MYFNSTSNETIEVDEIFCVIKYNKTLIELLGTRLGYTPFEDVNTSIHFDMLDDPIIEATVIDYIIENRRRLGWFGNIKKWGKKKAKKLRKLAKKVIKNHNLHSPFLTHLSKQQLSSARNAWQGTQTHTKSNKCTTANAAELVSLFTKF